MPGATRDMTDPVNQKQEEFAGKTIDGDPIEPVNVEEKNAAAMDAIDKLEELQGETRLQEFRERIMADMDKSERLTLRDQFAMAAVVAQGEIVDVRKHAASAWMCANEMMRLRSTTAHDLALILGGVVAGPDAPIAEVSP